MKFRNPYQIVSFRCLYLVAISFGVNQASIWFFFSDFSCPSQSAGVSTDCQLTADSRRMLNQFLTDCDTKSQLFAQAGEQWRRQRGDQTLSAKKTISIAACSATRSRRKSTVRRFTPTTTIEARGRVAQTKALCLF
jgi:hypothetical protein